MKKKKVIGMCLILCGIIILILINSFSNNKFKKISNNIEINNYDCKIENDKDTHGGFLGDGDYFAKITCSNILYDKLSSNWKELPLTETIKEVLEIKQCGDGGCKNVYEKYSIPSINDGYYYFIDRHSASKDKYDSSELNNRSSWNFTIALLDKNTNIIYYYEIDT